MKALIPNIGRISFKYRLFELVEGPAAVVEGEGQTVLARGKWGRIGHLDGECIDCPAAIHNCLNEIAGTGRPPASRVKILF